MKLNAARESTDKVMLAVPKTPLFEKYIAPVAGSLRLLGIDVLLVESNGSVEAA
jgi:hypothetical protein